ncbi:MULTISPECIES: response regulator [Microbacterium]|uniref:response regulator n=1 Tax=Microbacterium TaxID=33882 RepID=UPI0011EB729F|nr:MULTISPECIES: response regulator [Microbacterium]
MYVSVEVITMLATAATTLVAIISGFGWMIGRMDARFAAMETKVDARFAIQDAKFDRIEHELTEVKIAIARLEGPRPRLVPTR